MAGTSASRIDAGTPTYATFPVGTDKAQRDTGDAPSLDPTRLVNEYSDLILRVSYTYLQSTTDAEDICQDVLLKMIEHNPGFRSAEHERAWIIRATANLCLDRLRKQTAHPEVALDSVPEPAAAREISERDQQARSSLVLQAVMALPLPMRTAIYLHYYEGFTIHGIALLTDRTEAAVAQSLSRARKQLRKTLKGDDDVFDFA